jgi:hypothetical protein
MDGLTAELSFAGEWDEAGRFAAELETEDLPDSLRVRVAESRSFLYALQGRFDEADDALRSVVDLRASLSDPRMRGWERLTTAFDHLMAGRLEEAYAAAIEGVGFPGDGVLYNAEWATRAALWMRDLARAEQGLAICDAQPDRGRLVAADRLTLRAGVLALRGETGEALEAYREAARTYRELELPLYLGWCLVDEAVVLDPSLPEVAAAAAEARAIFERLGSPPLLARLQAGLAPRGASGRRSPAAVRSSIA